MNEFGTLESALSGLFPLAALVQFFYQSLHKLNEWTTSTVRFYRPHSWHLMQRSANATDFYAELPVLIFNFPFYFLYLFHMKYLYKISMCEAKNPNCSNPAGYGFVLYFYPKKICNSNHNFVYEFNVTLNVILTVRNSG